MASIIESVSATELGVRSANVASFVVFSKVYSVIVSGIAFIIVARLLGPSGYGIYTLALGAAGAFGAFGSLNIGAYFNKHLPVLAIQRNSREINEVVSSGLMLLIVIGLALSLVGIAFSKPIALRIFHNSESILPIEIAMVSIVLSMLYGAVYAGLVSFGAGKRTALASVVNNSLQAALSVGLVVLGFGALGAVSGFVIGLFGASLTGVAMLSKYAKFEISKSSIKKLFPVLFKFSSPLTGANIIGNLVSNFGIIILGAFFLPGVIGAYGVATKIGAFMDIIIGSIGTILVPMFALAMAKSSMRGKLEKFYNYSLYFGFLLAMPVIAYVIALSGQIVATIFSSGYHAAALYMSLIGVGLLIGIVGSYSSALLTSIGYVKKVFYYAAISGALQAITLVALSKAVGPVGVIIALYFVGGIANWLLYENFIRRQLRIAVRANILRLALANLTLFFLIYACSMALGGLRYSFQLIIGLVVLLFAYPAIVAKFGAVNAEQMAILEKLGRGVPIFGKWLDAVVAYLKIFV
ncbi:MAG: oligosaccharide flippase family protein [Candidatus Micrarchaeia archaeon]